MERREVRLEDCLKNYLGEVNDCIQAGLYRAEQLQIPLRTHPCVLAEITDPLRLSVAEWGTSQPATTKFLLVHPFGFSGATWVAYVGLHGGLAAHTAMQRGQTVLLCPRWPEQLARDPHVLVLTPTEGEVEASPEPSGSWGRGTQTLVERIGLASRVEALVDRVRAADPILRDLRPSEVVTEAFLRTLLIEALDALDDDDEPPQEAEQVG